MEIIHKHNGESINFKEINFGAEELDIKKFIESALNFRSQKEASSNLKLVSFNSVSGSDNDTWDENSNKHSENFKKTHSKTILNSFARESERENERESERKKESEKKTIDLDPSEISRLNPDLEILTEKDPDETIILPNKETHKTHNTRNRNQPL